MMKVSTNTRYAVNCIVDLASSGNVRTSLLTIATRQSISPAYLEQIFAKLKRAGLVHAVRGKGGGYTIAKPYTEITIADIMLAVEDTIDTTGCGGNKNCKSGYKCLSHDLWQQLGRHIKIFLTTINLQTLLVHSQNEAGNISPVAITTQNLHL